MTWLTAALLSPGGAGCTRCMPTGGALPTERHREPAAIPEMALESHAGRSERLAQWAAVGRLTHPRHQD